VNAKPVLKGLLTYIPGLYTTFKKGTTGGTDSAKYCYGVWLKHLTLLWANGLREMPETMLELGPGDSLGTGLAALLSGVKRYYAIDVMEFANIERNMVVFDELVELFMKCAERPTKGWPDFDAYLDSNLFPSHILTKEILQSTLSSERISSIKKDLQNLSYQKENSSIRYIITAKDSPILDKGSVDLILSHAVLEYVANLEALFQSFEYWLKPRGWMSHQIDFSSHSLTPEWNGHWAYNDWMWKLLVGKRPISLNREPFSTYRNLMEKHDFEKICLLQNYRFDGIKRPALASAWKHITNDDLTCAGAFMLSQRLL
jgi:hypothetical protein